MFKLRQKIKRSLAIATIACLSAAQSGLHAENIKPLANPIEHPLKMSEIKIRLDPIASELVAPVYGTYAPGIDNFIFVLDQIGLIYSLNLQNEKIATLLDLKASVVELNPNFDERGLLGLAFHPNFSKNGLFYTYISEPASGQSDFPINVSANHQTVITERKAKPNKDTGIEIVKNYAREILRVDQPQFNHNGGNLAFDKQHMLLISLGDGGASADKGAGHSKIGNGQDTSNPLGSILRIDPLKRDSRNKRYGIPSDNPFLKNKNILDEIWVYGSRNAYRFSVEGDLVYVADVGEKNIEEINIVTGGENLGWPIKEGTFGFNIEEGFLYDARLAKLPKNLTDPVAEYDHDEGISITGGFIYQGDVNPLKGLYLFGDWLNPISNSPRLMYLTKNNQIRVLDIRNSLKNHKLLGFGRTAKHDVLVLTSREYGPSKKTGTIYKISAHK